MPVTLTCEECEDEYQKKPSKAKNSRFCSKSCYNDHRSARVRLTCEVCGESFEAYESDERTYCSKTCFHDSFANHAEKECRNCGRDFTVVASKKDRAKYCSRSCMEEYRAPEREDITCETCGEVFSVPIERRPNAQFCSRECQHASYEVWTSVTCRGCGESFMVPPSRANEARFCSRQCHGEFRSKGVDSTTCEHCGNAFTHSATESRSFCTHECYCEYKRQQPPKWTTEKRCYDCGNLLPMSSFAKDRNSKDNRTGRCRDCQAEYMKQYQQENADEISAYNARYYQENAKTIKQRVSEYDWRGNNPTRAREHYMRYRAAKHDAEGDWSHGDILTIWHKQRGRCYWCGQRCGTNPENGMYEIDHITPLSKGGSNYPRNLAVSCMPCNRSKSDRLPIEFKRYRLFAGKEKTYAQGTAVALP